MAVFVPGGEGNDDNIPADKLERFLSEQTIVEDYVYLNQPINGIIRPDYNARRGVSLGFRGIEMYDIKLYSVDEKFMRSADERYFWPVSIWKPDYLSKEYSDNEFIEMMQEMEEHSWFTREKDQDEIIANQPYGESAITQ